MIIAFEENHYDDIIKIAQEELPSEIDNISKSLKLSLYENLYLAHQKQTDLLDLGYFVYIKNDIVVALCGIYSLESDDITSDWISWFFVKSEYKKQNIGKEMYQFIEEVSKSRNKILLKTYSGRIEGQLFREKMGFQLNHNLQEEGRKNYYKQLT